MNIGAYFEIVDFHGEFLPIETTNRNFVPITVIKWLFRDKLFSSAAQIEQESHSAASQLQRHESVFFAASEKNHAVGLARFEIQVEIESFARKRARQSDGTRARYCDLVVEEERVLARVSISLDRLHPR